VWVNNKLDFQDGARRENCDQFTPVAGVILMCVTRELISKEKGFRYRVVKTYDQG